MDFKEKLRGQIAAAGLNGFTERQLFARLNARSAAEKKEIKKALDALAADGVFIAADEKKKSGKYKRNGFQSVGAPKKYFTPESINAVKGVIQSKERGYGFLIPENGGGDIFIAGDAMNGALHKDTVYAVVTNGSVFGGGGRRDGKVAAVLERGMKTVVGLFKRTREGETSVVPDDRDYAKSVSVPPNRSKNVADGQKVVVKITGYPQNGPPEGEVTEILGRAGAPAVDISAIVYAAGFGEGFDKAVKRDARAVAEIPFDRSGRTDLTGVLTVTIDGDEAKDLDDAVSLTRSGRDYKLGVHIADVANYVRHNSPLDNEAFGRGTSLYYPGGVVPMLPEELSNGVCSLQERANRPTLTVEMLIDASGEIKGGKIFESVINSDARMTYKNVDKILNGDAELSERYANLRPMLFDMLELSLILNAKRKKRGSVFFESRESAVEFDEKGGVADIKPYEFGVSNSIIEEFMLAANETVAEFVGHMDVPFVYRVHENPSPEKMSAFKVFMNGLGFKISIKDPVEPRDIQECLDKAERTEYKNLVNKVLLRSMQKAKYDTANKGHFGLAAKYYCHFTSPIRRYPDLVAHRIIKTLLGGGLNDKNAKKMTAFCSAAAANSSERERAAAAAERQCCDYFKALYMENKIGAEYSGVISSVTGFGIFVELPNTVDGLVRAEWLPPDNYIFDEARYAVIGKKYSFSLGDKVRVRVEGADRALGQVNFSLITDR
ncbi:MAG: ribonuclease R [Clostridiales bacterium]|jgi:ribonuclease R|nr:ribonuclease R [Clostridiales bacterium]